MNTDFQPWTPDQPVVTVTITEPDLLAVKVFGVDYHLPDDVGPLTRASFGAVMDHLWGKLQQPFTVEITETDGSKHAGTIDLRPSQPTEPVSPKAPIPPTPPVGAAPRRMATDQPPVGPVLEEAAWVRVLDDPDTAGSPAAARPGVGGFEPGENVLLCLLAGISSADLQGGLKHEIPDWLGDVLLVGRSSGRVCTKNGQRW